MASLPDDTLRKILLQLQQDALQSQRALAITRQQSTAKDRERRIVQLTLDEIHALGSDVKMYKGVGKMFVMVPRATMEEELNSQGKKLSEEISALGKKTKFLEKQSDEAQARLRDIFHHAPKQ